MSPIELPPSTSEEADRRQSHDYPNMTKGNPIQEKVFYHQFFPSPTPSTHPIVSRDIVIRYRIASMAARFRSAWLGTSVLPEAQGVRGLSPKAKLEKGAKLPFVCEL
ncbi:hypothetical protein N7489_010425 [Penicillium chrysogenum]|uniref:Uncharacterized protein n=1 Tax=Penicillium chrysogenum TaxID=5076 RepID=A0ABQ8WTR9_PENCH|nr:uncharacterized protein N7489_010425 [Penicillium chrysogenum]XP_061070161.1 uncharacterized protein N7525_004690 [Penicillium rubens]KAJ5229717.1 hypothetical protein N7489_010425 [Penicillium chrysogenum]KAJ5259121.1 hypothetical protein N7524_010677 [Penicillium chrysogenum]KAJ5282398.1 hypothetical protein N7505_000378 [Penicillium chrysogenum]KAJ5839502.1 hypothetical protein N7525_004690 [Penicillium rubens]KAJ5867498.1 hypothetical protein N7534_002051 [Penicillium rubens]